MPFTTCFSKEPWAYIPAPYEDRWGDKSHQCTGCDECEYHNCRKRRDKKLIQECLYRIGTHGFVINKQPHITVEGHHYRYDLQITADENMVWKLREFFKEDIPTLKSTIHNWYSLEATADSSGKGVQFSTINWKYKGLYYVQSPKSQAVQDNKKQGTLSQRSIQKGSLSQQSIQHHFF